MYIHHRYIRTCIYTCTIIPVIATFISIPTKSHSNSLTTLFQLLLTPILHPIFIPIPVLLHYPDAIPIHITTCILLLSSIFAFHANAVPMIPSQFYSHSPFVITNYHKFLPTPDLPCVS